MMHSTGDWWYYIQSTRQSQNLLMEEDYGDKKYALNLLSPCEWNDEN